MPHLPAEALHPQRTCNDCKRVMLRTSFTGPRPEGAVIHLAKGLCKACYQRHHYHQHERPSRAVRDPHMTTEQTRAGLAAYLRGRDARRARTRRQALAAALSNGWSAV